MFLKFSVSTLRMKNPVFPIKNSKGGKMKQEQTIIKMTPQSTFGSISKIKSLNYFLCFFEATSSILILLENHSEFK